MTESFPSLQAAKSYLVANKFVDAHVPPDRPQKWVRPGEPKEAYAISHCCDKHGWRLVSYPVFLDISETAWLD